MLSKYLTEKVEYMTSSLFTFILLWATKLHIRLCKNNNNNNPKQQRNHQCCYGLQTLIQSEKMKLRCKILHYYNVAAAAVVAAEKSEPPLNSSLAKAALESSWWSWPSSPPEFRMGDVIGTESGYCMMSDVAEQMEVEESEGQGFSCTWRERRERERGRKREIPLPITLLRMPWNFMRECGDDGRLIVRAVKRREYVEGNREISGRVIMRLVQQEEEEEEEEDDDCGDFSEECGWLMDEEAEAEEEEEEEGVESAAIAEEEKGLARLESESERCGDLRHGVSYSAGGWVGVGDGASGCLGRPASVPIMPMTPVM